MLRALNVVENTGAVRAGSFHNTILDPKYAGKTVKIDITKFIPAGLKYGDKVITNLALPWELRRPRQTDGAGCVVLTRPQFTFNALIAEIVAMQTAVDAANNQTKVSQSKKDSLVARLKNTHKKSIVSAAYEFLEARSESMSNIYQKQVGRVRNGHSAMLTGRPAIGCFTSAPKEETFKFENFFFRKFTDIEPWEVAIGRSLYQRIAGKYGYEPEYLLVGRFPTTAVMALKIVVVEDNSFTFGLSNKPFVFEDEPDAKPIHTQDLVEGDFDGDNYPSYVMKTDAANEELCKWNENFRTSILVMPRNAGGSYTYKDHSASFIDVEDTYLNKIKQKLLVGPWSLRMYEGFVLIDLARRNGVDTKLTPESWRKCATQILESVFDLKHDETSHAELVNGVLSANKGEEFDWIRVRPILDSAGIDTEALNELIKLLYSPSGKRIPIRNAACENLPYAILHGGNMLEFDPIVAFEQSIAEDTTLAAQYQAQLVPQFESVISSDDNDIVFVD